METNKLYINPYIRLLFLICFITGTILINNILWLVGGYVFVILPLFLYGNQMKKHIRLMLLGMFPVYLSFVLLYIIILKGSNGGWEFINLSVLKLTLFTSTIQLTLLIPDQHLISTFKSWGLKGETLMTVLGAYTVWTDVNYRANQIITARFSRGFIKKRTVLQKIKQFPHVLIPLVVGIIRTATERAESWEQKNIMYLVEANQPEQVKSPVFFTESKTTYLTAITGNNFSGRSSYLKTLLASAEESNRPNIYIGEQPSNFITGIFPTVKSEINLHLAGAFQETKTNIFDLFSTYGFEKHQDKNPFSLSGGEQAILVILSNLLLQPSKLAIDVTIEQLSEEWRTPLLNAIQKGDFSCTGIYLSDNRLKEYNLQNIASTSPAQQDISYELKFENPFVDYQLRIQTDAKNIELVNLSFAYTKDDVILDKINVCLEPGNIYHLKGPNGVGKSTLAKILTGILRIKNGRLLVDKKDYNAYKYPGSLVGYSFQNPDEQLFSSTVENEVLNPMFLNMFGLQNIRKSHPAELPFVIRKRIALAATLAMDRAWYILDEPTLGQDDSFAGFLVELLELLVKQGKGIIIISHSESFVNKLNVKCLSLQKKYE